MNPDQQIELYRAARAVAWSYRLEQYDAAALKDLQRIVDKSKESIVRKFADGLGQEGSYTRKHFQNTLKELERLTLGLRNQLGEELTTSTSRIGSLALREWGENLSVGGLSNIVNTVALSPEQFKAFFIKNPPAGILIPKVMRNAMNRAVTAQIQGELLDVLREGALTGQSYKRIVDTLEESFTDFNRTQLTTLTRTFFQTANAQAFDAVYQANQDIVEGKIWTNVNDDRVCLLCLPLGETLYKKGEEHPPMPRHPNCRCVFRAKTVSYRDLGIDLDELEEVAAPVVTRGYEKNGKWIVPPAGTGTGRRPRAISFYQGGMKTAFPDLPEAQQKAMLGVGRYNLYKAGDLELDQLVDKRTGKLWLLKEIEQGMHLRAPDVSKSVVSFGPPVSRPAVDQVQEQWTAVQASDEFVKKVSDKERALIAFREAEARFADIDSQVKQRIKELQAAGIEPGSDLKLKELRSLRTSIGTEVYNARTLNLQLSKELKTYEKETLFTLIRPVENAPPNLTISNQYIKTKTAKTNFEDMKAEVAKMLHADVIKDVPQVDVIVQKRRAYYRHSFHDPEISIASLKKPETLIHEFGHAIEYNVPGAKKAAQEFRRARIGNEKLSPIYKGRDEMGWKDEFFNHYCGKYYKDGATEIISMGLEEMYKNPIGFLSKDPEYFELILKVMWGDL